MLTSSRCIHPVAVGDHVYLVEDIQYRITKLSPDSHSVSLQKINSRDRPVKRSIRQIWLPPPATSESFASADLPTTNYFCPEPLPPPVLPDVMDTSMQDDRDKESGLNDWVTVTTDFSSVTQLDKAFQDARREAEAFYDMYTEADLAASSAQKQVEHLTTESQQLRSSLDDLIRTHNSLMADSFRHLEEIRPLRTHLTSLDGSHTKALDSMMQHHVLSLPTDFNDPATPDDTFYHFLRCNPSADMSTIVRHANTLLRCLHPDKATPTTHYAVAASRLVPLLTIIKRVLTHPGLRKVYDHCGLLGFRRFLDSSLRCYRCTPRDADDNFTKPGRCEFPQLFMLSSTSWFFFPAIARTQVPAKGVVVAALYEPVRTFCKQRFVIHFRLILSSFVPQLHNQASFKTIMSQLCIQLAK